MSSHKASVAVAEPSEATCAGKEELDDQWKSRALTAEAERDALRVRVGTAWYDGFVYAITSKPWDDCYDWAALNAENYARQALAKLETSHG